MEGKKMIEALGTSNNASLINDEKFHKTYKILDISKVNIEELLKDTQVENVKFEKDLIHIYLIDESEKNLKEREEKEKKIVDDLKNKRKVDNTFTKIIKIITGSINPVVPLLAGCGMGKVLLIVLNLLGILPESSQTYGVLKFIFDVPFYFLPGLVGFSAAKVFKTNQYIGAFMGLMLVHPTFRGYYDDKTVVQFLGITIPIFKYSAQIIPAILSVWITSYVHNFFDKKIPEAVRIFTAPLLTVLLMGPITLICLAPIGSIIGNWIAGGVLFAADKFGFIAIAVLAAVYPWLVTMGLHKALSPVSIMLVAEQGYDPVVRSIALCSNIAQAASCLAISIKAKNKNLKAVARAGAITAFLGGYTETALYGVNLRLKRPMIACMIGAATSGVFAGIVKLKAYAYITPAILSLPMWIGKEGNFLIFAIITMLISTVVTFIATLIIGFDESQYEEVE